MPADFGVPYAEGETSVIGVLPGKIITEHRHYKLPASGNQAGVDLGRDIIKVAVIERHGVSGNHANGFVQGFGLKKAPLPRLLAMTATISAWSASTRTTWRWPPTGSARSRGGFVVVEDGKVTGEISLPVAGLMSLEPYESVRDTLHHLRQAAFALGATLQEPFLQLAFLPLPVIPHLKISDMGLVDVDKFALIG